MRKVLVDAGVPVLVFLTMVIVRMELTADDFRRVARQPWAVVVATLGQCLLLSMIGWLLVHCLVLQTAVARGVLLVAACPSVGMANVYTYFARANVALSVTLPAVSCLAAVLTIPLILTVLQALGGKSTAFPVPFAVLASHLFLLLLLPVLAGMGIRRRWPEITQCHGRALLGAIIAALAVLLAHIIAQEAEQFAGALADLSVAVDVLTVLAFGAGWATGWSSGAGWTDCFTVAMIFVTRNVGIATAIAVSVPGRVEFAVFATAYFLAQAPILVAAVVLFRRVRVVRGINLVGADPS